MAKVKMAMVSSEIRRDLHDPIRGFDKIEVVHFYKYNTYDDMEDTDLTGNPIRYRGVFDLLFKLLAVRPDIIQGPEIIWLGGLVRYSLACLVVCRLYKIPLFFPALENRPLKIKYGRAIYFFVKWMIKFYAERAKFIVVLNKGAEKNLLEAGVEKDKIKRFLYGTWGVDTREFAPAGCLGRSEEGKMRGRSILFVGRLVKEKGIYDLLQAFMRVQEVFEDVSLIFVGDGPLREDIEGFKDANRLENKVVLVGKVKNKYIAAYFQRADVAVSPSITTREWEEQVGMVNIQSMACGVPVVSTVSGAIPEYVIDGQTGILVPEGDSDGLSEAIVRLLSDETLRKRMGEAARSLCVERYDAEKNVKKAESLILKYCLQ